MARNYLCEYIRESRLERHLRFGDVARALGARTPRELHQLSEKLVKLERDGSFVRRYLEDLIPILELDPLEIDRCRRKARDERLAEWTAWADEPVQPEIRFKPFPGFWLVSGLPRGEWSEEGAIEFTRRFSEPFESAVLIWTRRTIHSCSRGVYLGRREAKPGERLIPWMSIA